jgi:hypothetical protein
MDTKQELARERVTNSVGKARGEKEGSMSSGLLCVYIYIYIYIDNTWSYMASIVIEFNMKCLIINDDIYETGQSRLVRQVFSLMISFSFSFTRESKIMYLTKIILFHNYPPKINMHACKHVFLPCQN